MGFFSKKLIPAEGSSSDATGKFSSDLASHAKEHIEFLRGMHAKGISLQDPPPIESFRRYKKGWLPLVQENPHTTLVPPDDIAWLWHCHRLAPKSYQQYMRMQSAFENGVCPDECPTLEAKPCFAFQSKGSTNKAPSGSDLTRQLWDAKYPKEDFFLSRRKSKKKSKSSKSWNKYTTLNGFDLLGSSKRQAKFLWQVSGPRYSDPSFLQEGVQNYYKFLKLRTHAPEQILVPTLQIDLLWHTHILISIDNYNRDCMAIMNSEFHHDDSIEDEHLQNYFQATKKLWKKHYHQEYYVDGGMDRGAPPKEYWKKEWAQQKHNTVAAAGTRYIAPSSSASSNTIVWVWKETPSQIGNHPASQVILYEWVQYNQASNDKLEQAFQNQQGQGTCTPKDGYMVNFGTMKQSKVRTGVERDVQRMEMVWCWEETQGNMSNHNADAIFGDPADRMVKYDAQANSGLETAYQSQGGSGTYSPLSGYVVDFAKMAQTKTATGFQRSVQRVPVAKNTYEGLPPPMAPPESALEGKEATSRKVYNPPTSSGMVYNPAGNDSNSDGTNKFCTRNIMILFGCLCCVGVLIAVAVLLFGVMDILGNDDGDEFYRSSSTASPTPLIRIPTSAPVFSPSSAPIGFSTANKRYLCGTPPRENSGRSVPTCLRVTPLYNGQILRAPSRPLCLSGNEPENLPPMWCYQDMTANYDSYHLWWSPCTRCGTAWRLDEERDDDKSMFKLPFTSPSNNEMPPKDNWLIWVGSFWNSGVVMQLVPCDPQECWVDPSADPALYSSDDDAATTRNVILAIAGLVVVGTCVFFCCAYANSDGTSKFCTPNTDGTNKVCLILLGVVLVLASGGGIVVVLALGFAVYFCCFTDNCNTCLGGYSGDGGGGSGGEDGGHSDSGSGCGGGSDCGDGGGGGCGDGGHGGHHNSGSGCGGGGGCGDGGGGCGGGGGGCGGGGGGCGGGCGGC